MRKILAELRKSNADLHRLAREIWRGCERYFVKTGNKKALRELKALTARAATHIL